MRRAEWPSAGHEHAGCRGQRPIAAWRKDVALEVWVDGRGPSIGLRLSGTLDQDTATNLASLVEELIGEGGRDFHLETHTLHVTGAGGQVALAAIRRLIQTAGGRLFWDGSHRCSSHRRSRRRQWEPPHR